MKNLSQISDSKDIITKEYLVAGYEPLLPATPLEPATKYLNGLRQWSSITIGSGGYAANLYGTNFTSTIVPAYYQMSYTADPTETVAQITRNTPGETMGGVYLFEQPIGVSTIDGGTWKFSWTGKINSTAGNTRLRFEIFVRTSGGTETALFSVTTDYLKDVDFTYNTLESVQPIYTVNTTDRLGVKTYLSTTNAASITGSLIIGGPRSAYMNTPLNLRHTQLRGLNDDSNNVHVTSTERTNLTAITELSTTGFIKRTGAGTYEIDSSIYSLSTHNHTGVYQPLIYNGTTATAIGTAAKTATISGYTATIGNIIALTLTNGNNAASITLNINSLGAIAIRMNNIATNTTFATLAAGAVILLYYDGTYFQMLGSQRTTDTDTYDRTYWNGTTLTAGATIYSYKLLMEAADGKWYPLTLETGTGTTKTVSTQSFLISSPILWYSATTTISTNGTFASCYSEISQTNLNYTGNASSWTSQLPIYLKGTVDSSGYFVLDNTSYTSWLTQTLPTSDDGFIYIFLGYMYSTTGIRLTPIHPIYQYKDGKIRTYLPEHNHNGTYQPVDANLTAIAGLTGTTGLLRKTAANTWTLDTTDYGNPVQIKRW